MFSSQLDFLFDCPSLWEPSTLVNEQRRAFYGGVSVCVLLHTASLGALCKDTMVVVWFKTNIFCNLTNKQIHFLLQFETNTFWTLFWCVCCWVGAVQGRRSGLGRWLIYHWIETIWVTLIWGPLPATVYLNTHCTINYCSHTTLYTENYTYCTVMLETWQTWEICFVLHWKHILWTGAQVHSPLTN